MWSTLKLLPLLLLLPIPQQKLYRPVADVVGAAVDVTSAVEAGSLAVKWQLTDAAAQASHVPGPVKTAHFEQVTLLNRLRTTEANVTAADVYISRAGGYDVIIVDALLHIHTCT